jgi:Na+/H+ antiporter NhaD/arsenite permease-like protein
MTAAAATIFILTYAGVALGRVPGLMLDRTGIALLGAIAMVLFGVVSIPQATQAVDIPTILLLYALMIVSAQLRLGGFYTWVVLKSTAWLKHPQLFLMIMMALSALLSAVLANDIVCLAFTPVLALSLYSANMNPVPFLLGLAISSNIGSAATIIGNPQNMLIGQMGKLHFGQFLLWCGPPSLISLIAAYFLICRVYEEKFIETGNVEELPRHKPWPVFNQWQSIKGLAATGFLMVLFFTPIPREYSAIAVAGILLCSRKMRSRSIMEQVDWHLITLFCALFVVIYGIGLYGIPTAIMDFLFRQGIDVRNLFMLTTISTVMSNLVSNVPATLLLIQFLEPSNHVQWYVLALSSTYAGNLILIGSIANLIVIEQARFLGIRISFKEHAKTGVPVTLVTLLILTGWIYVIKLF